MRKFYLLALDGAQVDAGARVRRCPWLLAFSLVVACGSEDGQETDAGGGNGGSGGIGASAGADASGAGSGGFAANAGEDGGSGTGGEDASLGGASGEAGSSTGGAAGVDSSLGGGGGAGAGGIAGADGGAGAAGADGAAGAAGAAGAGGGSTCCAPDDPVVGSVCVTPCSDGSPHYCPQRQNSYSACANGDCSLVCDPGYADCDPNQNGCETNITLFANCGACGNACATGQYCSSTGCVGSCGPSETVCGDRCVDTASSPTTCGNCNTKCSAPDGSMPVCSSGACSWTCAPGYTLCGGSCVDTKSNPSNCGGCGQACSAPTGGSGMCAQGACQSECPTGTTLCGNTCCNGGCIGPACSSTSGTLFLPSVGAGGLTADSTHLYFIAGNEIRRVAFAGGPPETLASGQASPKMMVLDATHVYWTSSTSVNRVLLGGGTVEVVSPASSAVLLAEHDGFVYWTENPSTFVSNAWKVPKTGGSPTSIWNGVSISDIDVDPDGIYLAEYAFQASYMMLPLNGGPFELYPCPPARCTSLAPDGPVVFASGTFELSPASAIAVVDKSTEKSRSVVAASYDEVLVGLTVDATHLYFNAYLLEYKIPQTWAIRRVPKCWSGAAVDVATGAEPAMGGPGLASFTLGPQHVYFSLKTGDIWRQAI